MRSIRSISLWLILILSMAACSTTKFVGENEYLLDAISIESDNPDYKASDLRSYVKQTPNFKAFGLMKWQLNVYNWSGKKDNNWINKQLRRMGEAPVIMDTTLIEQSTEELQRFLNNKGYVNAEVSASIDTAKVKKATVTYHITSNDPYRIRNYQIALNDQQIDSIAHLSSLSRSFISSTFRTAPVGFTPLLSEGSLFDRDLLDNERQRVAALMRGRGYYAFNRDHLHYLADSSFNKNIVDVDMQLRPFRLMKPDGSVVDTLHRSYYINEVKIITDYDVLGLENTDNRFTPTDTVSFNDLTILYGQNGRTIRPSILRRANYIIPGELYNERNIELTYSTLSSLRALKNVNIRYSEIEENDTMKLNCTILTSPAKIQSIGFDVEGTNSAGDLGFATSVNYQHRNLFRGSEVFSARIRGAYESLSGGNESSLANYWEIGGDVSVTFPRFIFPFLSPEIRRRLRASTEVMLSYNKQTRPEYERNILSGGLSYGWLDRNNSQARHTFKLIDLDYVFLPRKDSVFMESLPTSIRMYNYSNQFIMGAGYTYSFNNYDPLNRKRDSHSLRFSLELAGNILNTISHLANTSKDENGLHKIFGISYAQFAKADIDLSKGIAIDERNQLAFHLGFGVAVPYGNSKILPFERRYFSGGANSVRGWSVRTLGPGSMPTTQETSFASQIGDVRLDFNMEYRTKLFWKFELATYIDAGNIWTIRPYEDQPDGNFDFSRFYKEIAFSYGFGLRLDFDFFLVRLDTGFKAYDPQQNGSAKWAIKDPNFGNNFAWHFAVGYPF